MTDERRLIGDWEVLQGIHVGDKEVVLLHDPRNAETPYAVSYNKRDNSMGIEYTAEAVGSGDYLEMMEEFLHRVQGQVDKVRADRERTNEPQEVFGEEALCQPHHQSRTNPGGQRSHWRRSQSLSRPRLPFCLFLPNQGFAPCV